jgi:uncharacterized membrane protein YphA (DoxX/SURF4 family)
MTFDTATAAALFLIGRILLAGVLGFLALGNLLDLEGSVGYAEFKGVPFPTASVVGGSLLLLGSALSIGLGVASRLGALGVVVFMVAVTPVMHDFYRQEGEDRENELIHFLKNVALAGAALILLALGSSAWPYALASVGV